MIKQAVFTNLSYKYSICLNDKSNFWRRRPCRTLKRIQIQFQKNQIKTKQSKNIHTLVWQEPPSKVQKIHGKFILGCQLTGADIVLSTLIPQWAVKWTTCCTAANKADKWNHSALLSLYLKHPKQIQNPSKLFLTPQSTSEVGLQCLYSYLYW